MIGETKTRKPEENELVVMRKLQDALAKSLDDGVTLAQENGIKPYVFLDLWLNVVTDAVVGMMVDMMGSLDATAAEKRTATLGRLKVFLEGSMIIADIQMKKAWGEK